MVDQKPIYEVNKVRLSLWDRFKSEQIPVWLAVVNGFMVSMVTLAIHYAKVPHPPVVNKARPCIHMQFLGDRACMVDEKGVVVYCTSEAWRNTREWLTDDVPTMNENLGYRLCTPGS